MVKRTARVIASTAVLLILLPVYALASNHTAPATPSRPTSTQPARPDSSVKPTTIEARLSDRGQERAAAARLKAAERLAASLELHTNRNEKATTRVEAVIARLSAQATESGEATTDDEALADIEAVIEAEVTTATAEQLDILAEVKIQRGKKDEAKGVLRDRLAAKPNSKAAYQKLIDLEVESGEKKDLDTFVAGKKVQFDVRPMIKEGRTLMPIRALIESLGADIQWDGETRTVTIKKGESTIILQIGSTTALVNGQEVTLDVAAAIEEGRTLIPARFVSEGLGLYVSWLAEQRTILVTEEPVVEDGE
jgi:hypothetical protein